MAGHLGQPRDKAESQAIVQGLGDAEVALRAAISKRLGDARFRLWFGEGIGLKLSGDGDALEVRVPSPYFREWIESHYTTSLLEVAEAVIGRRLQVLIQVHSEAEPILGDVVAPAPADNESDTKSRPTEDITIPIAPNSRGSLSLLWPASNGFEACSSLHPSPFPQTQPQPPKRLEITSVSHALSLRGPLSRPSRRLENFVIGPGNRLAHAASCEMAQLAGRVFNPLVIHGAIGLGKTHLLEGIAYTLKSLYPTLRIIQLTAEAFTNSFLESMRTGCLSNFRRAIEVPGG